jgi:hypothetical protein
MFYKKKRYQPRLVKEKVIFFFFFFFLQEEKNKQDVSIYTCMYILLDNDDMLHACNHLCYMRT